MATFLDLSDELLFHTFSFLEPQDLGRLAKTCSRFRPIAQDNLLWRTVIQRLFPHLPHEKQNLQGYLEELESRDDIKFRENLSSKKFSVKQYTLPFDPHEVWAFKNLFEKITPLNDHLVAFSNNQVFQAFSLDTQKIHFKVTQPFCIHNHHLYCVENNAVYQFKFDTEKLKPVLLQGTENPIQHLDVHGQNLAAAYKDGSIVIWSLSPLDVLTKIDSIDSPIDTLKFNRQGTLLVIRYKNNQCKVWSEDRLFQLKDQNYFQVDHFDENRLFAKSGHPSSTRELTLDPIRDRHWYGISQQIVGFYKNQPIEANSFDVERLKADDLLNISIPRQNYFKIKVHIEDDYMVLSNSEDTSIYDLAKNTLIGSFDNPSDSLAAPVLFKRRVYTLHSNILSVHEFNGLERTEEKKVKKDKTGLLLKILNKLNH